MFNQIELITTIIDNEVFSPKIKLKLNFFNLNNF